jgi:hypothetical protein
MLISRTAPEQWLQPVAWLSRDVLLAVVIGGGAVDGPMGKTTLPVGVRPPYGTVLLDSDAGAMRLAALCPRR